jgi:hypothetical protein
MLEHLARMREIAAIRRTKSPLKMSVTGPRSLAASAFTVSSASTFPYSPPITYRVSETISGSRSKTFGE